jgi:hypothetical protein
MSPRIHRIEDNQYRVYHRPFHDFPSLSHHSHPYYAILNAYTKFSTMEPSETESMPMEHRRLKTQVMVIHSFWEILASQLPMGRAIEEENEDGHDGMVTGGSVQFGGDHTGSAYVSSEGKGGGTEWHGNLGGTSFYGGHNMATSRVTDYSENIPRTAVLIRPENHTLSSTNTTNSVPTSPLIPPSLESDDLVEPDDSASVVSRASTGFRSGYEDECAKRKRNDIPVYYPNVNYWRKNVPQDVHELHSLRDSVVS